METDVAIIGGGLAGLTAAIGLTKFGIKPIILESDTQLGGRAKSWIDPNTKDAVTLGPHIFLSDYPNMMKLLNLLGTTQKIIWQKGKNLLNIAQGEKIISLYSSYLPPPLHLLPALLRQRDFFPLRDTLSNFKISFFCAGLTEDDIEVLDNENAYDVLRRFGVTEESIQREWAFMCMAIMNVPIEQCSAGALLRFHKIMVSHSRLKIGFADGGLGDLFVPQTKTLIEQAGGQIFTNAHVGNISIHDDTAYTLHLIDGRKITAKYIIAALTPSQLNKVLPDEWRQNYKIFQQLDRFTPSPYISTYLWFDRKITNRQFWARNYNSQNLNTDFYDYSNIYTQRSNNNSLIASNCIHSINANELTDTQVIDKTLHELQEFLPKSIEAKLKHSLVTHIPMAIHAPKPGTEQLRATTITPIKNLFIAGDWTKTHLPCSMESACRSGWQAAETVLKAMGQPIKLAMNPSSSEGISLLISHLAPLIKTVVPLHKKML